MCRDDNNSNNNNNNHWFGHVPKLVETSHESKVAILRNQVQTDRPIHNNKPEIIIRGNKKRNVCVNRYCYFREQECDQERSRADSNTQRPYKRTRAHVECKNKSNSNNNKGNGDHLKISKKTA